MPTVFWQILHDFFHGINSEATICLVPMAPIMEHAYGISVDLRDFFHGINSEATICLVPMAPIMEHAYGISFDLRDLFRGLEKIILHCWGFIGNKSRNFNAVGMADFIATE